MVLINNTYEFEDIFLRKYSFGRQMFTQNSKGLKPSSFINFEVLNYEKFQLNIVINHVICK